MRHFNINGASPAYPTDCFARYNLIVTASTRQTIPRDKGNEIKTHTDMDMEIDVEKIWGGSTSLSHHFVCWWPCFSVLWMHSLVSITPCFICLGYPFFSMRTFHSFFFFYSSYSAASTLHFAGIDSHITLSHAYTDDDIICIFSLFYVNSVSTFWIRRKLLISGESIQAKCQQEFQKEKMS